MIYSNVVRLLTLVVGCLYPAFASYKILNGQRRSEDDMRVWLCYWVVYGVFLMFDFISAGLGSIIPFLNETKLVFLCWLLPTVGAGSLFIYDECLCSFFSNNETTIDQAALTGGDYLAHMVGCMLGQLMTIVDGCFLSRGRRHALEITPSIEDIVNDVIARRQLEEKRVQLENLDGSTEPVPDNAPECKGLDSLESVLNEFESDLLVYPANIDKPKQRPQTPPKPKRIAAPIGEDAPEFDRNQYRVPAGNA
ncbi:hypothetical protein KR009_010119 [Drosophila setifemur]|nr:hypothetical protein KR009_010119 [Drosophila setifemur]